MRINQHAESQPENSPTPRNYGDETVRLLSDVSNIEIRIRYGL
jgi:hypothetical protein